MKILNENRPPEGPSNTYAITGLGLIILIYAGYCLSLSTTECVYFFGKSGLVEDCSESRNFGYGSLAVVCLMGVGFCIIGVRNLLKNKSK